MLTFPLDNSLSGPSPSFVRGVIGGAAGGLFVGIVAVIVFVVLLVYKRKSGLGTYN